MKFCLFINLSFLHFLDYCFESISCQQQQQQPQLSAFFRGGRLRQQVISTVSNIFQKKNDLLVAKADLIARKVVGSGKPACNRIKQVFGVSGKR